MSLTTSVMVGDVTIESIDYIDQQISPKGSKLLFRKRQPLYAWELIPALRNSPQSQDIKRLRELCEALPQAIIERWS